MLTLPPFFPGSEYAENRDWQAWGTARGAAARKPRRDPEKGQRGRGTAARDGCPGLGGGAQLRAKTQQRRRNDRKAVIPCIRRTIQYSKEDTHGRQLFFEGLPPPGIFLSCAFLSIFLFFWHSVVNSFYFSLIYFQILPSGLDYSCLAWPLQSSFSFRFSVCLRRFIIQSYIGPRALLFSSKKINPGCPPFPHARRASQKEPLNMELDITLFTLPHAQAAHVIVYRPLAGARLSASAAATVPSRSSRVSSVSALPTATSVSPSISRYSFASPPGGTLAPAA